MKIRLNVTLWTVCIGLLLSFQTIGQITICDNSLSSHPVDIKVLQIRDSLRQSRIDRIIVYRHWLGTNGYNGYGKVIWIDNGMCFQYKIEMKITSDSSNYELGDTKFSILTTDSIFSFISDNHIDTLTANPTKQSVSMSHDASHYVNVDYKDKNFCFLISGLLVQFNSDNLRSKLVKLLADEDVCIVMSSDK